MITLGELAAHLRRAELQLTFAVDREVRSLMEEAAKEAKALIGHELEEWPALAESTVSEKQTLGYTGQISETDPLLRTGKLRDSIKSEAETTGFTSRGFVGSDNPVAAIQEHGTSRLPPRPFIAPSVKSIEPRSIAIFGRLAVLALTPGKLL